MEQDIGLALENSFEIEFENYIKFILIQIWPD